MTVYSAVVTTGRCFITHDVFPDTTPGVIRLNRIEPYDVPSGAATGYLLVTHCAAPIVSTAIVGSAIPDFPMDDDERSTSGCTVRDTLPTVGTGVQTQLARIDMSRGPIRLDDLGISISPTCGLILDSGPASAIVPFTVFYSVD
jgi:hypothetical protein